MTVGRQRSYTFTRRAPKKRPRKLQAHWSSVGGKVMEQVLLESIKSQMKQEIRKSQHRSTEVISYLTNRITFYDNTVFSIDTEGAADSKTFNTVSRNLFLEKLKRYRLDRWSVKWVGN